MNMPNAKETPPSTTSAKMMANSRRGLIRGLRLRLACAARQRTRTLSRTAAKARWIRPLEAEASELLVACCREGTMRKDRTIVRRAASVQGERGGRSRFAPRREDGRL